MGSERVYYGDFRLYGDVEDFDLNDARGVLQTFQGVERTEALTIALSPNFSVEARVAMVGVPNTADRTRAGWNALKRALRAALRTRSMRSDPLMYVRDDANATTVLSIATVTHVTTAAAHGLVTGDYVLICRPGAGLFTLSTVTVIDADEFTVAAAGHSILAGDVVVRVDEWQKGLVYQGVTPAGGAEKWYARELTYAFAGSGTSYARASATVGV